MAIEFFFLDADQRREVIDVWSQEDKVTTKNVVIFGGKSANNKGFGENSATFKPKNSSTPFVVFDEIPSNFIFCHENTISLQNIYCQNFHQFYFCRKT